MDEADYYLFERAFRRAATVFRLRLKEPDMKELATVYFRALSHVRLDVVLAGAKVCLTKYKTFPKPIEWLDALPPPQKSPTDSTLAMRDMRQEEADGWSHAERLRYEDSPCSCVLCCEAGVTDQPLRFVPNVTVNDRDDYARHPVKQRPVTTGHWAHGEELARWYVARAAFFALGATLKPSIRRLLPPTCREREPGEEG